MAVEELYDQLKSEGVEFPPVDLDNMAPIETPDRVSGRLIWAFILIHTLPYYLIAFCSATGNRTGMELVWLCR